MPIPLITAPAEFDFIQSAEQAHTAACYDFPTVLDHYWTHQYIFKTPTYFMMAGHDPKRPDAWLIWWLEIHPDARKRVTSRQLMRTLLHCVPFHKPWIGWSRPHKGRPKVNYYSTKRLVGFTQG
jgi:hypothetical protein